MNALATAAVEAQQPTETPRLRTILLTDLCDSTQIVEELGDGPAAALFREHDRLVLQLQQRWHGRLIDRSDGMLLVFERPIDGLGFALDYTSGLRELGAARKIELRARTGLHVGEVLSWRNSDEAVRVGAKPLEIEGLAKPMAARLMTLARPGQILVSAVAEPLAHRAQRELGERADGLLWKSHGRWRFKGLPTAHEIFEVGEAGIAPLRIPRSTPKVWRDIPLWRRPRALAAEVLLVVGIGLGIWFVTKPQPAIAFQERDWVVVADMRNLTGDTRLDDSLEQAFRISLEQSRHVNVLSDLKVRDTLARMRREPGTTVDRGIASQVAQRDGARAVILPTVSEVGGHLRVSVEVIDPATETTVYAHTADGKGEESVLASIDEVTEALRNDLGEAVDQIERDSKPLPEVTTQNIDALRAYALGEVAYSKNRYDESLQLYQRATELDPDFAFAWLGQVRAYYSQVDAPAAMQSLRHAQALGERLPPKEQMYVDAWVSEFDDPAATTQKWVQIARLYPDFLPGRGNAAIWLYEENRFEQALEHSRAAGGEKYVARGQMLDMAGRSLLGMEKFDEADEVFRQASEASGGSQRRRVAAAAARGDFPRAKQLSEALESDNPHAYLERTSLAVDEGDWRGANQLARTGVRLVDGESGLPARYLRLPVAVTSWLEGESAIAKKEAAETLELSLEALSASFNADARDDAATVLASALLLQRMGDKAAAPRALGALERYQSLMKKPQLEELATVLRARQMRQGGDSPGALSLLKPLLTGFERYQTRVALLDVYDSMGNTRKAIEQARWLQSHRGLAYMELECGYCLQALNVADSNLAMRKEARLLRREGKIEASDKKLAEFRQRWNRALPPSI